LDVNSPKDTIGQIDVNAPNWQAAIKRKRPSGRSRLNTLEVVYTRIQDRHAFIVFSSLTLYVKRLYVKIEFINGRMTVSHITQLIASYHHCNCNNK